MKRIDHNIIRRLLTAASVALCLAAMAPGAARADEASARAFFKDKLFRFMTMGGAGGGFDSYMRIIEPFLEKRLGVKVLPQNEPGAGGLVAMNKLIRYPADGLAMVLIFGTTAINGELYGTAHDRYKVSDLEWLARVSANPEVVIFGPKTPFKTFADAIKAGGPLIWGGTSKTDGNTDWSAILSHAMGMKAKLVNGYKSGRNMAAALMRGETDAQIFTDETSLRATKSGPIRGVATLDRQRSPLFPDVPTIYEIAKPTQEQAWWLDWRSNVTQMGRVLVAKKGIPADRLALLRTTLADILKDPEFLATAKKRRHSINPLNGVETAALVEKTMAFIGGNRHGEIRQVVIDKFYKK